MATAPLHYNDATKQLKAWLSGVYTTVSGVITGSEVTKTTTGNIDDLDFSNATIIRMNNASDATIRGMLAGVGGQEVTIVSVGAGNVFLAHQNASDTTAANRLINTVTSGNTPLAAGVGYATYKYDATTARWRLTAHSQGQNITPGYSGGDYTAAVGTWTVGSGDVAADNYLLVGATLFWNFNYASTSCNGATQFHRSLTNSWTVRGGLAAIYWASDNGAVAFAVATANNGDGFFSLNGPSGAWANSTDNTQVRGQIFIPIT